MRRRRLHRHHPNQRLGPYPYQGPCTADPPPEAQGGQAWYEICECGATRMVNSNNGAEEVGGWVRLEDPRRSYQ